MKKRVSLSIALAALLSLGMFAVAAPAPVAHAVPKSDHTIVMRTSGTSANAGFTFQRGDITVFVNVMAALNGIQGSMPISGPAVGVSVIEANNVTKAQLNGVGVASVPGLTIDSKGLASASLPATELTIEPTQDNPGAFPPYQLQLGAVSWTGEGPFTFSSQIVHFRIPHVLNVTGHFSGKSRMGTAALASIMYTSPLDGADVQATNLTSDFADLSISGSMIVTVQHA